MSQVSISRMFKGRNHPLKRDCLLEREITPYQLLLITKKAKGLSLEFRRLRLYNFCLMKMRLILIILLFVAFGVGVFVCVKMGVNPFGSRSSEVVIPEVAYTQLNPLEVVQSNSQTLPLEKMMGITQTYVLEIIELKDVLEELEVAEEKLTSKKASAKELEALNLKLAEVRGQINQRAQRYHVYAKKIIAEGAVPPKIQDFKKG
jgi:hypothetical protein